MIFKQQPQKLHDILPKNLQIDRSFFTSFTFEKILFFSNHGNPVFSQ